MKGAKSKQRGLEKRICENDKGKLNWGKSKQGDKEEQDKIYENTKRK